MGWRKEKCHGIEFVDKCSRGEVFKLSPVNRKFFSIFQRMLPGLFDGLGGVNYSAITQVMDLYHIPDGQRPIIMDKVLIMTAAQREVREANKG